ncbi:hypothetical protein B0J13DRAFT_325078 [Dactylonectria estremocensis]|uniref:SET domain-containing protein n=1 Tax=Dactylonectria estremocensis TaxID=1079267 RepID=A0A9P9ERK1_9HYPO|nr:hypothetical protein B0J13DRAFT_325078 [Dactylonectria estremocensis]
MATSDHASALVAWATSHGARLHPSVQVYQDADTGLSFRVKPDAETGTEPWDPIVSLLTSLSLSYLNALPGRGLSERDGQAPAFPASFLEQTPPHVIGRFVLAAHFALGDTSFWAPYIRALPQPDQVDSWALPPFWPDDEAELLDGTNIEVGIAQIRSTVKREFKAAQKLLLVAGWAPNLASRFSLALYQWAYSIFSSRSFRPSLVLSAADRETLPAGVGLDDFSVLLPLFDVGNHDMTEEVRWELDESRPSCDLRVARAYKPGEQVFNNYSMKTNAELLLGYGFMLPETDALHNDYVHVRKRQVDSAAPSEEFYISLRPICHPSSLLARTKQTIQLRDLNAVPAALQHVQTDMAWDVFCAQAPDEEDHAELLPVDASLQGAAVEQARQEAFLTGKVARDCRNVLQQTVAVIQHKAMLELERLRETDVEVVGGGDLTRNQQLALDYRARCGRVLENTLMAIDTDEEIWK